MSNMQLMQDLYAALGRGDMPSVLGAMEPVIQWREAEGNPYGKAWLGPEAVLANLFMWLAAQWDDFTVHPEQFYDAGPVIVIEARYTGTFKQTGKELDAQVCHIWKIRDGQVTSFQQCVGTAQLQDVAGTR